MEKLKKERLKIMKSPEEIEAYRKKASEITQKFVDFYRANLNLPSKEYDDFIESNRTDLPITFRVNRMR